MKKRSLFFIGLLLGCFCSPNTAMAAAETPAWQENNPCISVDRTDFKELSAVDYFNLDSGIYEPRLTHTICGNVYLLMVNGGFVPNPDIQLHQNGTLYISSETLETIGIHTTAKDGTVTFSNGTHTLKLQKNADIIMINDKIYAPLRFVTTQFGGKVEYLQDYKKTLCHAESKDSFRIHLISVETEQQAKAYTSQEKTAELQKLSAEEYAQISDSLTANPFSVRDTGKTFGRYDIYEVTNFSAFPIFVNQYTGEVYSENPWLPIMAISKGFPDLSKLY